MPARSEVDRRFTWKSEAIFADADAWEAAVAGILAALPDLAEFKGHLADSPDMLADWFEASEKVQRVMEKVRVYTGSAFDLTGERRCTDYRLNTNRRTIDESYRKTDSKTIEFPVTIPPDGQETITYTAHHTW